MVQWVKQAFSGDLKIHTEGEGPFGFRNWVYQKLR